MTIRFSMGDAIELARYQKAPIYLHPTFFITAVMLAWPFWSIGSLRGLELAGLFIVVILGSVLLHELAHAVMAERYGLSALRIDIHALGGVVQFWYQPLKRSQDFAITLAGPASNLAIGLVALALLALVPPPEPTTIEIDGRLFSVLPTEKGFLEQLLRGSAYLNLGLCVVNLIPAFPLDGGKLVYLEPVSKSSEEDNEAGELDKAEEVLSVVLPADEDATLPLYPGEEPLDEPASHVTA